MSNALERSKYNTSMFKQESLDKSQLVTLSNRLVWGERPGKKPCWEGESKLLSCKKAQIVA